MCVGEVDFIQAFVFVALIYSFIFDLLLCSSWDFFTLPLECRQVGDWAPASGTEIIPIGAVCSDCVLGCRAVSEWHFRRAELFSCLLYTYKSSDHALCQ